MPDFWKIVNQVINSSDVILLVLDARLANESRNLEIEDKVRKSGKKFLYVINKIDVLEAEQQRKIRIKPSIFVSAKERTGTLKLLRKILMLSKKEKVTVGILGYPNTGKSSLINVLKGKSSAPVSSVSGFTKGLQKVRIHSRIVLLDTPGVFPYKEKNETKHALIGAKDFNQIKDPEEVALELISELKGSVEEFYGVDTLKDSEQTLERIGIKKNYLGKKGKPDIIRTSKQIIKDWQDGKIKQKY